MSLVIEPVLKSPAAQVEAVRKGLSYAAFDELRVALELSASALMDRLGLSERTLSRRRRDDRFTLSESERILRLMQLVLRASDVLESQTAALTWLKTPKVALGGETPLAYAETEPGALEVGRLLGRIEYGVFS